MRKKIPTVTRPDAKYSAALQSCQQKDTRRDDEVDIAPAAKLAAGAENQMRHLTTDAEREATTHPAKKEASNPTTRSRATVQARTSSASRKVDIRVNALERQEAALTACGVEPAHVVRAALRRAIKGWHLLPVLAPISEERRTRNTQWQARTSLAVDANSLNVLLRDHDPLDVLSKWALVRGQLEQRVWREIDTILEDLNSEPEPSSFDGPVD